MWLSKVGAVGTKQPTARDGVIVTAKSLEKGLVELEGD
jgi:hypothetical protein